MNSSDELPMSVSTRKMRSSRTISKQVTVTFHSACYNGILFLTINMSLLQDNDEYSSDFDEFGYDNDLSMTHDTPEKTGKFSILYSPLHLNLTNYCA